MSSTESFTYGSETIGGSAPTHSTQVLDHYMFTTTEDDAEFVCRFVVTVTPSGTSVTDWNALAAACQAIESNLRQRYQKLTVDWGASNQETFDPDVNASSFPSSGFDQEPHLEKVRDFPNSGEARAYEFRVRLGQYPNYTDAFGAAAGRRQVDVTFHYDVSDRLYVVMSGEWTQVPTALARAQFLAQFDGVSGYAAYRLSKINSTVSGATNDTWCPTQKDETDPNSFSTLRFTRRYEQHLFGRRGSTYEILYRESGQRQVTFRGAYLRTIAGTGGTYGNVYGTAAASSVNFADGTNGGYAFAVTQLAALTTAQGGALTVGHDCELLLEPFVTTNEQDDRTDYTLVFRELLQQQSTAAGNFLDDPNIVGDSIMLAMSMNEVQDSPSPPPASSVPGPAGSSVAAGGGGGVENSSTLQTVSKPVSPSQATNPSTQSGGGGQATPVVKPVDVFVKYEATFKKSVATTDLYTYWKGVVFPLLVHALDQQFGFPGLELVNYAPGSVVTDSKVSANLHLRSYSGSVILFTFTLGLYNSTGVRVDPAFTGTPHEYYVQQALPKTTMTRHVEAVWRTGSGFSLGRFLTPLVLQGWVKLTDAMPATVDRVLGIPNLGIAQTPLSYGSLDESLIWVARNVARGGSGSGQTGGGSNNKSQTQAPMTVSPRIATGGG